MVLWLWKQVQGGKRSVFTFPPGDICHVNVQLCLLKSFYDWFIFNLLSPNICGSVAFSHFSLTFIFTSCFSRCKDLVFVGLHFFQFACKLLENDEKQCLEGYIHFWVIKRLINVFSITDSKKILVILVIFNYRLFFDVIHYQIIGSVLLFYNCYLHLNHNDHK